jgi:hypothetical protein
MPPRTKEDKDRPQWNNYGADLEVVKAYLKKHTRELYQNIHFHKGLFPHSAVGLEDERFCLAHIDVDIYESTKAACEWVYPRMVPGGIMLFNDYSCGECPGATKAVDKYFADKPEKINCLGTEQTEVTIHGDN